MINLTGTSARRPEGLTLFRATNFGLRAWERQ